jgi:hypothetical protein
MKNNLAVTLVGGVVMGLFALFFAICRPMTANAAAPGVSVTGLCVALDKTCGAVDNTFAPTSVRVSNSGRVVTALCVGATNTRPTKTTRCDGEALGGTSGEITPTQPCAMTLGGTTFSTDDWSETITAAGRVSLACRFGGADKK